MALGMNLPWHEVLLSLADLADRDCFLRLSFGRCLVGRFVSSQEVAGDLVLSPPGRRHCYRQRLPFLYYP